MWRLTILPLVALLALLGTAPAAAATLPRPATAPVPGPVVRGFDAPDPDWLPGHRGVDLAAPPGTEVRAAAAGTVTFAGVLVARGVVVVDHGGVRTTYEPVDASVRVGEAVAAGAVLGTLAAGHPGCAGAACLHWGLRQGERYLDPRSLLRAARIRLVGEGAPRVHAPAWRRRVRRDGPSTAGDDGGPWPSRAGP